MFGQSRRAHRRPSRRATRTVLGVALVLGLLPAQALAVPPSPDQAELGRDELVLEKLKQDKPVDGGTFDVNLDSLKAEVPDDQHEAPSGTATPPAAGSGTVTFSGSAARTLSAQAATDAVPVGSLPVKLGQAPDQPAPTGTWQVSLDARTDVVEQGVDGAVLQVDAPSADAVPVSVELDYAKFQNLYGADWASRLRLVQFPDCFRTTPDVEECRQYEELETANDTLTKTVTATVAPRPNTPLVTQGVSAQGAKTAISSATASGSSAVVGAVDSGSGPGGTFKATPLASSGKWSAGNSSGAFAWSYPLTTPPAPAGPTPQVSLSYNSQEVDGKTAIASPQSSWIGEGWGYDPGHIERRYRSCSDDTKKLNAGTPNNTAKSDKTSDLCWVSDNAVMSLNGKNTELVKVGANGDVYRPQQDDGTRIELRTGATNDDNDGEYWVVTTTDGTDYYYGLNAVGGGHATTDSVSTVPVFGNHPGEPCHQDSFADSRCGSGKQQAWRWGLDKIVDLHGNTTVVNWKQETNYYSARKKYKSPEQYDRFAYPASIEYGMRADLTKPAATIEFTAAQRCLESATLCASANFAKTDDPGAYRYWWDTPGSLNCKSTSDLCPSFPSFWTQMRLDTITTKAARPGQSTLGKVDSWKLNQSFPEEWYDSAPGLWLNSITHRGYAPGDGTGTLDSASGVSFTAYTVGSRDPLHSRLLDRQLPNLVTSGPKDQRPPFTRPRIGIVSTPDGGDIEVQYTGGCSAEPAADAESKNGTCFPVRWSPDGEEKKPAKAWFNKYVVASVVETDKVAAHGDPIYTQYTYKDPAWAKSDDEFSKPSLRTYSDWRGYRSVTTTKGKKGNVKAGDPQAQSTQTTRYFQGTGGTVKDSTGTYTLTDDDAEPFAGTAAEAITYDRTDGRVVQRTLNYPWLKQTASRERESEDGTDLPPLKSYRSGIKRTDAIRTVGTTWEAVRTTTEVEDTYGLPVKMETSVVKPKPGGETLSEQKCVTTDYVHDPAADRWIIGLPKQVRTTATPCSGAADADPATRLIGTVQTSYDGGTYGAAPTKGKATTIAKSNGDGKCCDLKTTFTYDAAGRTRTVSKPGEGTAETQYTPAIDKPEDNGGPVTSTKVLNAMGRPTVTTFDPGHGSALTVTDPNNRVTRTEYDALGRVVKGWLPEHASATNPDVQIAYQAAVADAKTTSPAAITTRTLKDDGTYSSSVTLYDGLQRAVQTQTEAHGSGRIVTDTSYNDHGLVNEQTSPYLAKGEPSTHLFERRSDSLLPSKTRTRYDGRERPVQISTFYGQTFKYATYTTYGDNYTKVDAPGSTTPVTDTYTDVLGRTTSIRQYVNAAATAKRLTGYEYDARGNLSHITAPDGTEWTYTYNALGQLKSQADPDSGDSRFEYDDAGRQTKATDTLGRATSTDYDVLGRITKVWEGDKTGDPVKEYTYDTLPGALGLPVSSTLHDGTSKYVSSVTGYDAAYRPTGKDVVIPKNDLTKGLDRDAYSYQYTYTPTGKPLSVTLPAVGGLAAERVLTRYDEDGLAESTSGIDWYTSDTTYSPFGEVLRSVSGKQPSRLWTTNFIDEHTGRLQRTVTDRETAGPHRVTDSTYSYDASGLISSQARQFGDGTWDNQCYTYDRLGQLVHAWTSNLIPSGKGTGCQNTAGTKWGYQTNAEPSGPAGADASDTAADTTGVPDASLTDTLANAAPAATSVSTGATSYWQSFTYDWAANRATLTEHNTSDATKNVTNTYTYGKQVTGNGTSAPTLAQPHTLTAVTSTVTGQNSTYGYDDLGNTETRTLPTGTQDLKWTQAGRLRTATVGTSQTTYVYDTEGNRLLEHSATGSTLYLGETELTTDASGKITKATRSYSQAGTPTVTRSTSNGATTAHRLTVTPADPLGTSSTAVELTGNQAVTRREFKPYGETRGTKPTNWPDKHTYLGVGIDDTTTGLTHIGAREYDTTTGRFISVDPVMDLADPQQNNGYSYSNNSPVSASDPTGLVLQLMDENGRYHGLNGSDASNREPVPLGDMDEKSENYSGQVQSSPVWKNQITGQTIELPSRNLKKFVKKFVKLFEKNFNKYGPFDYESEWNEKVNLVLQICEDMECGNGGYYPLRLIQMRFIPAGYEHLGLPEEMRGGARFKGSVGRPSGLSEITGCNSFTADTGVALADGSKKKIEDVKTGDKVIATDPSTGESEAHKVTATITTDHDKKYVDLTIATKDGPASLTATEGHPFWSIDADGWIDAGKLDVGTHLRTTTGDKATVTALRHYKKHQRTYNLTVDVFHTYYVLAGETPVLVHNCAAPNIRISPAASDWATKGAHMHVGSSEIRVFPNGDGGVGFEGIRLSNGMASARDVATARSAIMNNPELRADLIDKARSAMADMNDHNWGNSLNRAPEMHFLIKALEKIE
ncbi:polymorphic toxin-type HINT domain-containing protein [Streptomyces sp. AM 3-1-1]|uniref:polymorphic toxin-type HINT domain-containing protein n=2 Tax=Streptomyces TaxID=1883 RepID=UPI0023B93BA5|nr:polymorphic toxin-type HINT domain-containing protein [Streptomyces sp. AM 3-1-1]WEH28921.1 polymorphic toxin-type HINT domain-containing protein [Streptomyces sp. AM 3-1-1]